MFPFILGLPPLPPVTLPISHNHPGALPRLPAFLFLFPLALSSTLTLSFFLSFLVLSLLCSFLSSDSSFILVCPSSSLPPSSLPSHHLPLTLPISHKHPKVPSVPSCFSLPLSFGLFFPCFALSSLLIPLFFSLTSRLFLPFPLPSSPLITWHVPS